MRPTRNQERVTGSGVEPAEVDSMQLKHWCLVVPLALAPLQPGAAFAQAQESPAPSTARPPNQPGPGTVTIDPDELPVSLDRIQRALANTPMLRFDESDRPVVRVEVFGERPTLEDILGPDWAAGPVKRGTMTHQEFLALVTPQDVQGYAPFSNEQGATVAATSLALQWTLQRALQRLRETSDERERAAARQEVLEALQALEAARAKAGLPPQ